jgi:hypothetical protein
MQDEQPSRWEELEVTGIPPQVERNFSSIFVPPASFEVRASGAKTPVGRLNHAAIECVAPFLVCPYRQMYQQLEVATSARRSLGSYFFFYMFFMTRYAPLCGVAERHDSASLFVPSMSHGTRARRFGAGMWRTQSVHVSVQMRWVRSAFRCREVACLTLAWCCRGCSSALAHRASS